MAATIQAPSLVTPAEVVAVTQRMRRDLGQDGPLGAEHIRHLDGLLRASERGLLAAVDVIDRCRHVAYLDEPVCLCRSCVQGDRR
ncbi:MAG TPA: hypothetical protein VKZ72_07895 [Acidimicrobiales bacterium]|nr:hypothetical protein [Acidimicrobiales bacterium]